MHEQIELSVVIDETNSIFILFNLIPGWYILIFFYKEKKTIIVSLYKYILKFTA